MVKSYSPEKYIDLEPNVKIQGKIMESHYSLLLFDHTLFRWWSGHGMEWE